jgi:hypothetical protein
MGRWRKEPVNLYDSTLPCLPPSATVWVLDSVSTEEVTGLSARTSRALTEAQARENRIAEQLRKLGELRPDHLPRTRR